MAWCRADQVGELARPSGSLIVEERLCGELLVGEEAAGGYADPWFRAEGAWGQGRAGMCPGCR